MNNFAKIPKCRGAAITLLIGVLLGSVYLMSHAGEEIQAFLTEYTANIDEGLSCAGVFKNALKENIILLVCIFAAGFFKGGAVLTALCVIKKGFVSGFCASAFFWAYGIKCVPTLLSLLPCELVLFPALLMYASISVFMSFAKNKKKNLLYYIFVTFFTMTIFCGAAFLEGYVTTIFMKGAAKLL